MKKKSKDSYDPKMVFYWVMLAAAVIIGVVFTANAIKIYNSVNTQDVAAFLADQGYSNIQVSNKTGADLGFGPCTRDDVARFDFTAVDVNGVLRNDLCICVGSTNAHLSIPQMTIRLR